ncbi:hypothetical protein HPB50_009822 [Hyalomma asiaticum]|uniref:Uncharacterized protein n=1 Tax=Hyalomma asiaticum TaxID=266040 RepID=A0ACB7TFB3_HYAAI|nr:hypothetical protein HPB50_009822 [Hyalomma asiaticum]
MPTLLNKQPLDPTYYSGLTGPERLRYAEKVEMCDRIDPFTLRPDTSSDVNVFPDICYGDIANYLVFSANYLTLEEMKAFKSTEAHNYFTSGWVKGLLAKQLQDDKVLLLCEKALERKAMGNCFKSMSSSEDTITLRSNEDTRDPSAERIVLPHPDQEPASELVYYVTPNAKRRPCELSEEEQVMIAGRISLIQQLPKGTYDHSEKDRECAICMAEFAVGNAIRFLPCMHIYHVACIDDWLMRSFTCPSCMRPVGMALLTTSQNI